MPPVELQTVAFDVEGDVDSYYDYDGNGDPTDDCPYDYLTVNGTRYCGTSGPRGAVAEDGVIEWRSDGDEFGSGWKACPWSLSLPFLLLSDAYPPSAVRSAGRPARLHRRQQTSQMTVASSRPPGAALAAREAPRVGGNDNARPDN